jgi:DNA modification methylase
MKHLVAMVTPKNGLVMDPFMGSGSTGVAAIELGMNFLGIEKDGQYHKIADDRLKKAFDSRTIEGNNVVESDKDENRN